MLHTHFGFRKTLETLDIQHDHVRFFRAVRHMPCSVGSVSGKSCGMTSQACNLALTGRDLGHNLMSKPLHLHSDADRDKICTYI